MHTAFWFLIVAAGSFIAGWLVSRNNPNIAAINKIIAAGQFAVDGTGKLVKKIGGKS